MIGGRQREYKYSSPLTTQLPPLCDVLYTVSQSLPEGACPHPPSPTVVTCSMRCLYGLLPFLPGLPSSLLYLGFPPLSYLYSFPCLQVCFWESPNQDISSSLNSQPSLLPAQEGCLSHSLCVPHPTLVHTVAAPVSAQTSFPS